MQSIRFKIKTNNENGFTLIEIMVAVTLMSFMVLGVYSILDNGLRTKDTVLSEDREYFQSYTAMYRIKADINQLWSPLYFSSFEIKKNKGEDRYKDEDEDFGSYEEGEGVKNTHIKSDLFPKATVKGIPAPAISNPDQSTFIFFTSSNRRKIQDQKQSKYAWVRYSLRKTIKKDSEDESLAGTQEIVRQMRADDPYSANDEWAKVPETVLMRGVKSLSFEFWSSTKKEWVESLKDSSEADQFAPRGVKIVLQWIDSSGKEYVQARIFKPLWPFFDVEKDEKAKTAKGKKGNAPAGEDFEEEEGEEF